MYILTGINSSMRMLSCGRYLVMPSSSQPELPLEYIPWEVLNLCNSIIIPLCSGIMILGINKDTILSLALLETLLSKNINFTRWNFLMHLCKPMIVTIAYLSPQIYFLFVEITLNVFHKYLECDCHV